jgi:phosphotransferase family enzyme
MADSSDQEGHGMDTFMQIQAVDQATLTPFVRQALGSESVSLIDWQVAPYGGGAGQCVYRFVGSAHDRGKTIPWSLVLKVVPTSSSDDEPSAWQYGRRELLAYQSGLLADLPGGLRAPRCFGVDEQPGGDGWLWLEEIADAATGRWPRERFTFVAYQLGTFSAAYLTGRPLPAYAWLSRGWFRSIATSATSAIAQLPTLLDHPLLRPALPGDTASRVLHIWDERETFFKALDQLPQTFCHLDAFPRNLFVRNEGSGEAHIAAIDWEYAGTNALGAELAPLVGGSLLFDEADLATVDELEAAVFTSYLDGLGDAGWRGDMQLVRQGYTLALVLHYVFLQVSVFVEGTHNEAFRQFAEQQLNRPYAKILDRTAVFLDFLLVRADEARQVLRSRLNV